MPVARVPDRSCREDLKPTKSSSTPAVVPGAAPALAKAGDSGFHFKGRRPKEVVVVRGGAGRELPLS